MRAMAIHRFVALTAAICLLLVGLVAVSSTEARAANADDIVVTQSTGISETNPRVGVLSANGSSFTDISEGNGYDPAVSAGGSTVVFLRHGSGGWPMVWAVNTDGTGLHQVTPTNPPLMSPAASPTAGARLSNPSYRPTAPRLSSVGAAIPTPAPTSCTSATLTAPASRS